MGILKRLSLGILESNTFSCGGSFQFGLMLLCYFFFNMYNAENAAASDIPKGKECLINVF